MSDYIIKDVCYPKNYTDSTGTEKTRWLKIGTSFEKDGKQSIEISSFPIDAIGKGELKLQIFERPEKNPI
jgi:hypothetical protein